MDDLKSSRPRLGSPDTTMIDVSRYCGSSRKRTIRLTPSAIRQVDIDQNCVILSCRRARERIAYRIGKIGGKSDLPQLRAQRERRIEIVFTKQ